MTRPRRFVDRHGAPDPAEMPGAGEVTGGRVFGGARADASRATFPRDGVDAGAVAGALGTGEGPVRVYVRSSHPEQDTSVEQQLAVAEEDLRRLGLLAPGAALPRRHAPEAGVYADDGVSAWKVPPAERPASAALLADLRRNPQPRGRHGQVWVWAQSRMLRPEFGAAEAVAQLFEFATLGWTVYSHEQGLLDLTGPDGLAKTITIALHGEKDAAHSREKEAAVRRAKRTQVEQGVWLGGTPPFGYERWAAVLSPPDPVTGRRGVARWVERLPDQKRNGTRGAVTVLRPGRLAHWVRFAFRLAAEGDAGRAVSVYELTRRLNDAKVPPYLGGARWGRSSVNTLLTNEAYIAVQRDARGQPHPALWEPLVDRATWDRVQRRLARNAAERRGVNSAFVLTGLLFCAGCGARFSGERQAGRRGVSGEHGPPLFYYRTHAPATREAPCPACRRRIPVDRLEPVVLDVVAGLASHPVVRQAVAAEQAARAAGAESLAARLDRIASEEREVRQQIDNLLPALKRGGAVAERVNAELDALNRRAAELASERDALAEGGTGGAAGFAEGAADFHTVWAAAGPAERKEALGAFVARIEVDGERGTVRVGVRPVAGGLR